MTKDSAIRQIATGVSITLLAIMLVGLFKMYTDLEVAKFKIQVHGEALDRQEAYAMRFDEMLQRFDKALAVQAETISTLKVAVGKLNEEKVDDRRK